MAKISKTDSVMDWDLSSYFPKFNGNEMKSFKEKLIKDINRLCSKAKKLPELNKKNFKQWEIIILKSEELLDKMSHIGSYVGCLSSIDSRNEEYQKEYSNMALLDSMFVKIEIELLRAVKNVPEKIYNEFIQNPAFDGMKHYLKRLRQRAKYSMTSEKESLAADLAVDGISAWGRLYDNISGKLEFEMEYPDGTKEILPISQRRSLMDDPDRRIRKAAFEGGNKAWSKYEDVAAASLNAIAGTRLTLNKHRNIKNFLDVALFQSAISQKTLNAMYDAIMKNIDVPKNILKFKAKTMNTKGIAWYDLGAPLDLPEQERITWEDAQSIIINAFSKSYPHLGIFLQEAFQKKWIEFSPRQGKRPGAFCTGSLLTRESRVYMTYKGSIGDILTLAHEVGHAFHSRVMKDVRSYAHLYPMTLAETASTFGEMILIDGILEDPNVKAPQKALILDMEINHGAIYLMDIFVRFEFEKRFYEERKNGEVSVSRFKELMIDTQKKIFGNTIEKGGEDPFFWVSKLHFYIPDVEFYNFPYTFGFLLSRGLYAMFKKEGKDFLPKYEYFLELTGSDTAENVAKKSIGVNLEKPDFWEQSIISLTDRLKKLQKILPKI